ncbi:MAG TPA: bacillithiol biosynthesis BshC, partial [Saprospiraceae bacterium]|nr:bacillithiol biosynthesis BshC [Saprospiraceae bacterium]
TQQQIEKSGLSWEDLLNDYDAIVKSFLHRQHGEELSFSSELDQIEKAYVALAEKAKKLDPTLATAILAEKSKQAKQFEQLGSRLIRAEKQHQETNLKRIQKLKEKLFPQGGLQERYDNLITYYNVYGSKFIEAMVTICDPMESSFKVVLLEQAEIPPQEAG